MEQYRKGPSYQAVTVAEYRLLNALIKNPEFRLDPRITEDLLVDNVAKSVFEAIQSLDNKRIAITPASLLQASGDIDYNVTQAVVQTVFDIERGEINSLDDILSTLSTAQLKNRVSDRLDFLRSKVNEPGDIDSDSVNSALYNIEEDLNNKNKDRSKLLDFDTWTDKYLEDLDARKSGRKYSFGDPLLDKEFFRGAIPGTITILCAPSSVGKSTFVQSLANNLLEMNSPCMYLSNEMGTIDSMDRLMSQRCDIDHQELFKPENIEGIKEKVLQEKSSLKNRKNFYYCEAVNMDMAKLKAYIREFKQRTHQDYCFVAIDLLSGMKDFMVGINGASTAATIEANMNRLEALAKEENVHILGVVQIRRDATSHKATDIDDLDKLRPTENDIKNSGSYLEKSSECLILWRPKRYAEQFQLEGSDQMEDILECQIVKNRSGETGKILKYMFDGQHFKVFPLVDEEVEKMERLKNLNLDF